MYELLRSGAMYELSRSGTMYELLRLGALYLSGTGLKLIITINLNDRHIMRNFFWVVQRKIYLKSCWKKIG